MEIKIEKEDPDYSYQPETLFVNCDNVKENYALQDIKEEPVDERESSVNKHEFDHVKVIKPIKSEKTEHKCPICQRTFSKRNGLSKHLNSSHDKKKVHNCEICGFSFKIASQLKKHLSTTHATERSFECAYCSKTFKGKGNLLEHITFHLEKPRPCPICNKILKNSRAVKKHMRNQHRGSEIALRKPVSCHICGKIYSSDHYHRHLATHVKIERSFKCEICHREFGKSWLLKDHMSTHSAEKPFACDVCSKTFRTKVILTRHKKCHVPLTEPPKKCLYCSKTYRQHSSFDQHMIIHHRGLPKRSNKIPVCTVCNTKFKNLKELIDHVKIHKLEKRFECATCGAKFVYKSKLKYHIDMIHLNRENETKEEQKCVQFA